MIIQDERVTGIYKFVNPLEKGGFYCDVTEYGGSVWVRIYVPKKWFWGWFNHWENVGTFHPKSGLSVNRLYVRNKHDEVVKMLEKIPEFKDVVIILEGQKDVGGTRVVT